jgi:hypothetical protein
MRGLSTLVAFTAASVRAGTPVAVVLTSSNGTTRRTYGLDIL